MRWLHNILLRFKFYQWLMERAKRNSFPGFGGVSIYTVATFFLHSIEDEDINLRASSLAFNFFLALFPAVIFFFTLVAYVPIQNMHSQILEALSTIMPAEAFESVKSTLEDILKNQRGGLLSVGFVAAIYFSSNGYRSMIRSFNKTNRTKATRSFWVSQLIPIGLTLWVSFLLILSVALLIGGQLFLDYLFAQGILNDLFLRYLVVGFEWIIIIGLFFTSISSLYYFGPIKKNRKKWRFVSTGSSLATFLSIASTVAFSAYINNFNSYNKLYGSIGTLIVLMMIIYFNSIIILIGFEMNSSIDKALKQRVKPEELTPEQLEDNNKKK